MTSGLVKPYCSITGCPEQCLWQNPLLYVPQAPQQEAMARCRGKARSSPRPECPGLPHRVFLLAFRSNQPSEHYSEIHLNKHSLEYANEAEAYLTGSEIPTERKQKKKINIEFYLISKFQSGYKSCPGLAITRRCQQLGHPVISGCQALPLRACSMEIPSVCTHPPPWGSTPSSPLDCLGSQGWICL